MPDNEQPRIYVASLSDYNAGRLHGIWIDADDEADTIWEHIRGMLARSREPFAEEWAIHDYEGFHNLRLGEWESIERVARIGRGIAEHGEAFALWVEACEPEGDDLDGFEDAYRGQWDSAEDYAGELWDDLGFALEDVVPESLRLYVRADLEAFARDLASEVHIMRGSQGVHVFED